MLADREVNTWWGEVGVPAEAFYTDTDDAGVSRGKVRLAMALQGMQEKEEGRVHLRMHVVQKVRWRLLLLLLCFQA